MDEMDSDLALEVLDTPDRFPSSSDRRLESGRTYAHLCRDFSRLQNRAGSSSSDDTDFLFSQARLAQLMSEPSPWAQSMEHELKQIRISNESRTGKKTIDLNQNSKDARKKIGKEQCIEIESTESYGGSGSLGVGSSCPTRLVARSGTVISLKPPVNSSKVGIPGSLVVDNVGSKCRDKGKVIDLCSYSQPRTEQATSTSSLLDAPRGKMKQRRLVRNGCISPSNIAKNSVARGKNVAGTKVDDVGNTMVGELPNGHSSHPIHIVSPDSEGSFADKKKKKVMVDNNGVTSGPHAKAKFQSSRVCSALVKEVTVIADVDGDTLTSDDIGRRTAHNPSDKSHVTAMGHGSYVNVVCGSPEITALQHGSNLSSPRATSESGLENKKEILFKGKRKYSQIGECSSSIFDDSEISLQSSSQPSNSKANSSHTSQHHGIILGPVIEVGELRSPEAVRRNPRKQSSKVSDDFNARAGQVESDEMLARQLQEQFYNESPVIGGTEEIDANIAWSLQQEEDAQRSSIAIRDQFHRRGASATHSNARLRNSSARSANHARLLTSTRIAQLRRNVNRHPMDLEARLDFLEEMEAALDNVDNTTISNRLLQRDFNENDYEMLLTLDENNNHVGATVRQINNLPQSVIETDNFEEACVVCLEPPVIGDTIRHLPCFHKFHKECIDTWLRRRRSCPICKCGIT